MSAPFARSLEACEAAISERNDQVRAILHVLPAPKKADKSAENGPISGVPYSLKDTWDTAGIKTTGGSWRHRARVPNGSSKIFETLQKAGGILVGKSNLCDMAFSLESDNHLFGPVRNPWDPARTSGGSTGGGAAAIASGMSNFDWGSDFGGSIRMPAAFCGIAGIRLSNTTWPIPDFFPVTPHLEIDMHGMGPLAKNVAGLRAVLDAVRADLKTGIDLPKFKADRVAVVVPDGATIGAWRSFETDAVAALKKIGASWAQTAKTPSANEADLAYDGYLCSHFEAFLATGEISTRDGIEAVLLALASWGRIDRRIHPNTALLLGMMAAGRGTIYRDAKSATAKVRKLQNTCNEIWANGTLMLAPTTTFPAPHHGRAPFVRRLVAFAKLGNLSDSTSLAVPFGKFANGLPRSIQVLGPAGSEEAVLDLGEKLEAIAAA